MENTTRHAWELAVMDGPSEMPTLVSSDNPAIIITDMSHVPQTSRLPGIPPQISSDQILGGDPTMKVSTLRPGTDVVREVEKTTKSVKRSALSNLCCITCCGPKLPKINTNVTAPLTKTKETIETATDVVAHPIAIPQVPFDAKTSNNDEAVSPSSRNLDVSPHSNDPAIDDQASSGSSSSAHTPPATPKPVPSVRPDPPQTWFYRFRKTKPE